MLESFFSRRATLIFLAGVLSVLGVSCSEDNQTAEPVANQQSVVTDNLSAKSPVKSAAPVTSSKPQAQPPAEVEPSSLELALDKAAGAMSISQSAQSVEDWYLVANQFQEAIALMQRINRQSPNFKFAQRKIKEYQRQIKYALHKANPSRQQPLVAQNPQLVTVPPRKPIDKIPPLPPVPTRQQPEQPIFSSAEVLPPEKNVFIAPIKRRVGGTPIVEVTFNGQQKFDMILDTGASGTVITQQMANALGIIPVGRAKANTASSRAVEFPVGYVDSMAVGGVRVNRVPVAIAGYELETGLLGHDFFGKYDITIKRNAVEFRPQSHSELNSVEIEPTAPIFPKNYRSLESP